jgi:hypothetical protein
MSYVVLVILVKLVVCNLAKRLAPKYERLLDRQSKDLNILLYNPDSCLDY